MCVRERFCVREGFASDERVPDDHVSFRGGDESASVKGDKDDVEVVRRGLVHHARLVEGEQVLGRSVYAGVVLLLHGVARRQLALEEAGHATAILQVMSSQVRGEGLHALEVPHVPQLEHAGGVCGDYLRGVLHALAAHERGVVALQSVHQRVHKRTPHTRVVFESAADHETVVRVVG